jgi:hypothetical protein
MVDGLVCDAEILDHLDEVGNEPFGTADVHVPFYDVGHHPGQRALIEPDLVPATDDLVQLASLVADQFSDLLPQDQVGLAAGTDNDYRSAALR